MRALHASIPFGSRTAALLTVTTILFFALPIAQGAQQGTEHCLQYGGAFYDCKPPDFGPWGNYGTGDCANLFATEADAVACSVDVWRSRIGPAYPYLCTVGEP